MKLLTIHLLVVLSFLNVSAKTLKEYLKETKVMESPTEHHLSALRYYNVTPGVFEDEEMYRLFDEYAYKFYGTDISFNWDEWVIKNFSPKWLAGNAGINFLGHVGGRKSLYFIAFQYLQAQVGIWAEGQIYEFVETDWTNSYDWEGNMKQIQGRLGYSFPNVFKKSLEKKFTAHGDVTKREQNIGGIIFTPETKFSREGYNTCVSNLINNLK